MASFAITCLYCPGNVTLMGFSNAPNQTDEEFAQTWKASATAGAGGGPLYSVGCPTCGAEFQVVDDGVSVEQGGLVIGNNVSQPKLDSLSASTGPREGGNAVFLTGSALEVGALTVKVAGVPCATVDTRTTTSARVVMPPATYTLNVEEWAFKLTLSPAGGTLVEGEAITTAGGSTGTIRLIEGTIYWVAFANFNEPLTSMIGTIVTGGTSGGVATVDAAVEVQFLVNESLTGLTSAVTGMVKSNAPLRVYAPSGGFAPSEFVRGSTSGALAKLSGSPAYSGLADVSVENEYGQRLAGGTLIGAYTYA